MPWEDERTILPIGEGSKFVTLPATWCRFWRIKPGDRVKLIGNSIVAIIPPHLPPGKREELERKVRELVT